MAAAVAAAAAARRRRMASCMGMVVEVDKVEFLGLLSKVPVRVVIRTQYRTFWSDKHKGYRYLASVDGIGFYCDPVDELPLPKSILLVEADEIKVPSEV